MPDVVALHLAETIREALKIRETMRAEGLSEDVCAAALERSIREAWPKGRSEPWHYLCATCEDSGWQARTCTPAWRCGRPFRLPGQKLDDMTGQGRCGESHSYVVPCHCEKGRIFAGNLERRPRRDEEDFTQATKMKPPTRFGR